MEITQKSKTKKFDMYKKSLHMLNDPLPENMNYLSSTHEMLSQANNTAKNSSKHRSSMSPIRDDLKLMLAGASSTDIFTTDRHPRPKNFFHQAYIAKSELDTISHRSSGLSKAKTQAMIGKGAGADKTLNPKLPNINKRFNEDVMSQYSTLSK